MKNHSESQEFYIAHIAEIKENNIKSLHSNIILSSLITICSGLLSIFSLWALIFMIFPIVTALKIIVCNIKCKKYFEKANITNKDYKELKKSGELDNIRKRVMEIGTKLYKNTEVPKSMTYSRTTAFLSQPKNDIQERTTISTRKGQVEVNNNLKAVEDNSNNVSLNI